MDNLKGDVEAACYGAMVHAQADDLDPALRAAYPQKTVDILKAWAETTVVISGGNVFREAGNLVMAV